MSSVTEFISAISPAIYADSRLSIFLNLAMGQLSSDAYGSNYEYAVALLTCHMMARNPVVGAGTPGAVTNAQEGGVSQSYSIPPDLQRRYSDWCSTPYGAQLAQLTEGSVMGVMNAGGPGLSGPSSNAEGDNGLWP